jgi:hypothetical protein
MMDYRDAYLQLKDNTPEGQHHGVSGITGRLRALQTVPRWPTWNHEHIALLGYTHVLKRRTALLALSRTLSGLGPAVMSDDMNKIAHICVVCANSVYRNAFVRIPRARDFNIYLSVVRLKRSRTQVLEFGTLSETPLGRHYAHICLTSSCSTSLTLSAFSLWLSLTLSAVSQLPS